MQKMVHRRGDKSIEQGAQYTPQSDDDLKKNFVSMKNMADISRWGGAFCFLGLCTIIFYNSGQSVGTEIQPGKVTAVLKTSKSGSKFHSTKDTSSFMADYLQFEKAIEKYDNCVISYNPPPPREEFDTKPLWLTAFPGSGTTGPAGHGDVFKPLINSITGLKTGAKFYHASSKVLKRCKGMGEAVTCSNGHPVIEIAPERQSENFYRKIILVMRNFKTAFPTHDSEKGEAYHGKTGQNDIDSWRRVRDNYCSDVFDGWKTLTMTWKNMTQYEIGMYAQYENLFDPDEGPKIVQRMANLFKEAGFPVAPDNDLPCIWYQSVKPEYDRLKDYWKYNPGFTEAQREGILNLLDLFRKEVAEDKELMAILDTYYDDIQANMPIDNVMAPKLDERTRS